MTPEGKIAVVTDSASSIRPESLEARASGITIVPLDVRFWENGAYVPHSDDEISTDDFYQRMRTSEKLPQTAGAVPWRFKETFSRLSRQVGSIISINVTSGHSGAWASAVLAKDTLKEENPDVGPIEVIDSKLVSIATWFPTELAAKLSIKGATLTQIKEEVMEAISKTNLFITLQTFENLYKGGRANEIAKAVLASILSISPILGLKDGKLKDVGKARSVEKARQQMIEMVGDAGKLVRLAVVHTNAPVIAQAIKEALQKIFQGNIPIYEAGPVLAVHAAEGAIGIAFQKA